MIKFVLLSIGLVFALNGNSFAVNTSNQKLIEVRAEYWEQYTHADGSGYFYELIKAIYEPLGYQISFKFCPWKRCSLDMIQGKADLIIGVYDDDEVVVKHLQIPQHPIHVENNAAIFKHQNVTLWQGQQTMRHKRVAQVRGYGMSDHLDVPVSVVEVSTMQQGMQLVIAERVDYFISGKDDLKRESARYGDAGKQLRIEPVFTHDAYLGILRSPKGDELRKQFDQGFIRLYKEGALHELQKKWSLSFPLTLKEQ